MKLNPDKAEFMTGKVKYLGMMIEGDTFSIAAKKLETITSLPTPKTKKELVSQFALFQYYVQKVHSGFLRHCKATSVSSQREDPLQVDGCM